MQRVGGGKTIAAGSRSPKNVQQLTTDGHRSIITLRLKLLEGGKVGLAFGHIFQEKLPIAKP
jgi:hypothetical protein